MSTITTSLARLTGRRRAFCVPLLVAGALAAACGSIHSPAAGTAAGRPGTSTEPSASATSTQHPTPVPTITGGAVAGETACDGWPAHALHITMPVLFVPVVAERCVIAVQTIAGKGQWETATLEKASSDLTPLIAALRHPPMVRTPDTFCPDLAMLPPQILVISASGQELIPVLPVSGCGLVQSDVLSAIAALSWQPVSVRLVAKVATGTAGTTQPATLSPKNYQKVANQQPGVVPQ
jgi:hypothetical protein